MMRGFARGITVFLSTVALTSGVAAQAPHKTAISGFQQYALGVDMRQILRLDPQLRPGADEMDLVNPGFPTVNYSRRMMLPIGYEKHEATVTLQFWHSRLAAITITWGAQAFRSTKDLESQGTMMALTIIETYQGLAIDSGHGFASARDQQGNTVDVFTVTPNKPGAPVATPCVCLEYIWGRYAKALKDTQPKPNPSPY